jgi:hypothetical protein
VKYPAVMLTTDINDRRVEPWIESPDVPTEHPDVSLALPQATLELPHPTLNRRT